LLSVFHPRAKLLGISTVSGNASLEHTTHNALAILTAIDPNHNVPLVRGAEQPLVRETQYAPTIHGPTGLDGVPLLPRIPAADLTVIPAGVEHIASAILSHSPDEVWLIATGPLTNIAHLFRDHPEVASHIAGLSIMGGAVGAIPESPSSTSTVPFTPHPPHRKDGKGNWTPHAEFNIWCDPEAASEVFEKLAMIGKAVVVVPLDLTHQVRGNAEVQHLLFPASPALAVGKADETPELSTVRQMFKQTLLYFAQTYSLHSGIHDGPPLHDPLAVSAVLEPDTFDDGGGERWHVTVDCGDEKLGETVVVPLEGNKGNVRIPRAVDLEKFWSSVNDALTAAEQRVEA
jgi:uridine nucleosidase